MLILDMVCHIQKQAESQETMIVRSQQDASVESLLSHFDRIIQRQTNLKSSGDLKATVSKCRADDVPELACPKICHAF